MNRQLLVWVGLAVAIGVAVLTAQPAGETLETSWGAPDLQGLWTHEYQIPLQRPAQYAGQETLTDEELDRLQSVVRRQRRGDRGTEADVAGAYDHEVFTVQRPRGRRTALIIDPPDGRIPPIAPAAHQRLEAVRQFYLGTIQSTAACEDETAVCTGGTYAPPSPAVEAKRNAPHPVYPVGATGYINRADGPEDRGLNERCLLAALPEVDSLPLNNVRAITQSPGTVSIFYDMGQGQGWHRIIPVDGSPHLPPSIRLWWGDSRGHWEGNTLVVDVTNFSPRTDFQNSRENLHLVERWTRISPTTLEYVVTMDDPTAWTKPWTVMQEYAKQSDQLNQIYKEPRCHEGNLGMIGLLNGARATERALAEGKGPHPAALNLVAGPFTYNEPPNFPDR